MKVWPGKAYLRAATWDMVAVPFVLPELKPNGRWKLLLDTREGIVRLSPLMRRRAAYQLEARSLVLFSLVESTDASRVKRVAARHRAA
jgi:hypothetical protein